MNNKTGNHHSTAGHDTIATNHQGKINKVYETVNCPKLPQDCVKSKMLDAEK